MRDDQGFQKFLDSVPSERTHIVTDIFGDSLAVEKAVDGSVAFSMNADPFLGVAFKGEKLQELIEFLS